MPLPAQTLYLHTSMLSHSLFGVTEGFCEAITGCERIVNTPLPPGYVGVLRVILLLFLVLLPFAMIDGILG